MNIVLTKQSRDFLSEIRNWEQKYLSCKNKETLPPLKDFTGIKESVSQIFEYSVSSKWDQKKLQIRYYRPKEKEPLPLILYAHGGGWVYGNLDTHDNFCRRLARKTQNAVLSVDYRLAPKNRFPTAIHDFEGAYEWVLTNKEFLGVLNHEISFAGDSSGGNIVAATICKLIKEQKPLPKKALLIYPALDLTLSSINASYNKYLLTKEIMVIYRDQYLEASSNLKSWLVSPMFFDELNKFPKTILISAECDILSKEGHQFAEKLRQKNVFVAHQSFPGVLHGFMNCHGVIPEAELAMNWVGKVF